MENNINISSKRQNPKISKGYRLKESTHKMIRRIQNEMNSTQDKVISSALRVYYNQLKRNNNL